MTLIKTAALPRRVSRRALRSFILLANFGLGLFIILLAGVARPARANRASDQSAANASTLSATMNITPATTTRVSVASAGTEGNGNSYLGGAISANGRYIAFVSEASNLVPGDTNGTRDIFVHDQLTGQTVRASVKADGNQSLVGSASPGISANGRYVAFTSGGGDLVDYPYGFGIVVVKDMWTGQVQYVSHSNTITPAYGSSYNGSISADGSVVAFVSAAANLVPNDTITCSGSYTGSCDDVFVWNRQDDQVILVSVSTTGTQANDYSSFLSLSPNGRYVAFYSAATNLVSGHLSGVYLHDLQTGETTFIAGSNPASLSYDGRYIAFISSSNDLVNGDTNLCPPWAPGWPCGDVFVYDQETTEITLVSVDSDGNQGNNDSLNSVSISYDGRYVAFDSLASNLVISDTNNYHVCDAHDTALPDNCEDIFVHDRQTGETTRVSVASDGTQGNSYSYSGAISSDGRFVVFESPASTLVDNDTNNLFDIFVHDRFGGPLPWTLTPIVNVGVTKSASAGIRQPGQTLTYTLVFSNAGPDVAAGVRLTDIVPTSLTNLSVASSGAVITATGGLTYSWQIADLAPGAGGIITVTGVLSGGARGTVFTNTASITTTSADFDAANNNNAVSVTVANVAPVAAGDVYTVAWSTTLTVTASGVLANDSDANNDVLTATLAAGPLTGTLSLNTDGSFTYAPPPGFVGVVTFSYWANDSLADSSTVTVTLTVTDASYKLYLPVVLRP